MAKKEITGSKSFQKIFKKANKDVWGKGGLATKFMKKK